MKNFLALMVICTFIYSCSEAEKTEESETVSMTTVESMAHHYGIGAWDSIHRLQYTFVVHSPDKTSERKWEWFPQKDSIVYHSDSTVSYKRADLDTSNAGMVAVDQRFINDSYWLLFPFQVFWSEVDITETAEAEAPISGRISKKVSVQYGNKGYTPNDVYDLYLDENFQIAEWVFKSGGNEEYASPMTWDDHKQFGPLLISTVHKKPDGTIRITFKDVEVDMIK